MEKNPRPDIQLPPGFRFQPSDEELIVHYLRKKATKNPLPASIVAEVELYKYDPWDLPEKSLFGDEEWYFFTPRDRKYPNGMRPNRMAGSGYWKATGIDKPILTSCGSKLIGVKKALVFYTGRPPKGNKTDWIMHEYRLPEPTDIPWSAKKEKSMRLDECVLCRVRQKACTPFRNFWEDRNGPTPSNEPAQYQPKLDKQCSAIADTTPNFEMVREYINKGCPMLPFLFGSTSQDFPAMDTVSSISFEGNKTPSSVCQDNFSIEYLQNSVPPASNGLSNIRKRKLFEGNSQENFRQLNKKATARDYQQNEELPPSASASTINNVDNCMISYSTNQTEKNNYNVDQIGPSMMYQELYSLAFA